MCCSTLSDICQTYVRHLSVQLIKLVNLHIFIVISASFYVGNLYCFILTVQDSVIELCDKILSYTICVIL